MYDYYFGEKKQRSHTNTNPMWMRRKTVKEESETRDDSFLCTPNISTKRRLQW